LTFIDQRTTMTKSRAQQQGEESKDNKVRIPIPVFNPEDFYNWHEDIEVYLQGRRVFGAIDHYSDGWETLQPVS
jgi:hypothetical protein